ncbi:hypothetical protein HK104_001980 [Borealophlyctis nickersoniae]|nr:hypothetical protein HK104_001980 [Borealophlyctis nickersoniae]
MLSRRVSQSRRASRISIQGAQTLSNPGSQPLSVSGRKGKASGQAPPLGTFEKNIFTVLYGMTQGNDVSASWSLALMVIEDIQLLGFSFRPDAGFGGMPSWMKYVFNPLSYKPHTAGGFAGLFYFALALVVIMAVLTVFVGLQLKGANMKAVWPLKLLRLLIKLISTVLLIPIVEIFVHGAVCHDPTDNVIYLLEDPSQCTSYLHLMIPAFVGFIYLALQAPVMSLVFFHLDPSSKHPDSKTTGRIDSLYTILRFILVLVDELGYQAASPRIAAIVLASTAMFVATSRYQPFFSRHLNDARSGMFAASFFSGIQAAICYAAGGHESAASFGIMCGLIVPEFLLGFLVSALMRQRIATGVYRRMKAREEQLESGTLPNPASLQAQSIQSSKWKLDDQKRGGIINKIDDIVTKVSEVPLKVFEKAVDVEIACRFLQANKEHEASVLADAIFNAGIDQFPHNGSLALMKAYYIGAFSIAEIEQVSEMLDVAKCSKPAMDVRFLIFYEERQMEQEDHKEHLMTSRMNVTRYTESVALQSSARKYHLEALLAMKALWEYLKSERVSPNCIPYLLERVAVNSKKGEKVYEEMLDKYPNSKNILRKYSTFLMTVANDQEKATKLLTRAEDIENAEVRENTIRTANREDAFSLSGGDDSGPTDMRRAVSEPAGMHAIFETSFVREDSMVANVEADEESGLRTQSIFPEESGSSLRPPPFRREISSLSKIKDIPSFGKEDEPAERKIEFHKDVEDKPGKTGEWDAVMAKKRSGPGSIPSVPSATSSQRDLRQFRYYRTVLEGKLLGPMQKFALAVNIASALLLVLLVVGCVITLTTYGQLGAAVSETYNRTRPRNSAYRIAVYLRRMVAMVSGIIPVKNMTAALEYQRTQLNYAANNVLSQTMMPILQAYNLNDAANIIVRETRVPDVNLAAYNPYFIAKKIVFHCQSILNLTDSQWLDPSFPTSLDVRMVLDNIQVIADGLDATATGALDTFLNLVNSNLTTIYGLLAAIPAAALLLGLFLLRRGIASTNRKSVQLLSLALQIPRKFVNEKLDALEVEIENIMEEIEEEQDAGTLAEGATSATGSIPSESIMRGHAARLMTKRYSLGLCLIAITGTVMFIPAILHNNTAVQNIYLTTQLSHRAYAVMAATSFACETAANDTNSFIRGTPPLWTQWWLDQFEADRISIFQSITSSSIFSFPSLTAFTFTGGNCYNNGPFKCDPLNRRYNASVGLTQAVTLSSLDTILTTWSTHVKLFLAQAPEDQTFESIHMPFIVELSEDCSSGSTTGADLISRDLTTTEATFRAINIVLFVLAAVVLLVTYMFVFRSVAMRLSDELLSISGLFFALPIGLIQSIPDMKRFIESGGTLLPAAHKG